MKSSLGLLTAFALMSGSTLGMDYPQPTRRKITKWEDLTYDEQQAYIKSWNDKQEQLAINKGLKKFVYGDIHIFALNQKNADRKARKLNLKE